MESEFPSHGGWGRLAWLLLRARVARDLRDLGRMVRRWNRLDKELADRKALEAWWYRWQ